MKTSVVSALLALALPSAAAASFVPVPAARARSTHRTMHVAGDDGDAITSSSPSGVQRRREMFKPSSLIVALILGYGVDPSSAAEEKIYSANARNMARLNSGDSSGGSIYDNNPSSPKARARRAMVGCKNASARSLAGANIGKKLSEKDCNQMVMSGNSDFMLGALTELDCPTCPYGIGER